MGGGKVIESNCHKCSSEDTTRMVQCDTCDKWFHFDCVSVNSDVANVSWNCDSCNHHQPILLNNARGQNGQGQGIANSPPTGQQVIADAPPMNEMVVTQASSLATAAGTANAGAYTEAPTPTTKTNVTPSIHNPAVTASSSTNASAYKEAPAPNGVLPFTSNTKTMGHPTSWPSMPTPNPLLNSTSINASQKPTINNTVSQRDLLLQMLEEERELQKQYLEKKYKILSQTEGETSINNLSLNTQTNQPTPAQLAARQAIPKDLPTFDGNPEDWPLFISSFKNSTEIAGYTNAENLMRLQSCVKGKAKELVRSKLFLPSMVPEILQTLEMCYGRPEHILESLIEKARKFPPPKERLENLIDFALMVRNLCSTMEACSMGAYLNNPMLVKELVDKLPNSQKLNWAMHQKDANIPVVKTFSDWIYNIAIAASQVVSPLNPKRSAPMNTHTTETTEIRKPSCVACGNNNHKIQSCEEFRIMPLDEKWSLVTSKKLCRQCLNTHRRKCFINKVCGINNCAAKHHQLLHKHINRNNNTEQPTDNESSNTVNAHADTRGNSKPFFRFIPVRLYAKSITIETFAFLDEGSSVTLMEHDIFEKLNLDGVKEPLTLRWTGQTTREEEGSVKLAVTISGTSSNSKFKLNDVHTVKQLGLPTQSVDVEELVKGNSYLKGLPIKSYTNITPGILIGVNNWKLAVPLKVREGDWHQPIASKTRLGWTLQGPSQNNADVTTVNVHTCGCERQYRELHNQVKNYFALEASSTKKILSSDDQKVFKILEDTCQKKDGQYEIGLLWKNENVHLPHSYNSALNRLKCLQKKFKDTNLRLTMQSEIDKLVSKGYAKKLSRSEIESCSSPVWYLPIFIARNPNKPEKVRLVWDAASKANGVSLNDFMMSGPDLLRPLFEILLDFRVGKIAICGDISEMFHRINVRDEDMHVQRFLWFDDTSSQFPSVYVMKALTFGISCAPCIAHFVRDKNADMFTSKYPRAVKSIKHYHYMDDFIDSVDTEEEALKLATEVKTIHASAGFEMHNWTSNSTRLQYDMGSHNASKQSSFTMGSVEKILGMYWHPNNDTFQYICRFARLQRDVISDNNIPTKREVLQVLMSIFDPLGFISIYTIGLKILLQEIWRSKINWDDELSDDLYPKWRQWTQNLAYISKVTIPRCYSPLLSISDHIELHTFVDAGEFAYAAVCYILVKHNSETNISLVAAKSKVAPLKPVSIPRMELQAAVTGVRLATKILSGIRVNINNSYWWTDSKTVLSWLYMDPRNFKQFVMHRVGEILETTNTNQWKWVPSKSNPADAATKTLKPNIHQWFNGPEFLKGEKKDWPTCSTPGKTEDDSELRHAVYHIWQEKPLINFTYFSCWRRLYRALAVFILYLERLKTMSRKKTPPCEVSFEMFQKSKTILYKTAQQNEFVTEIADLKRGQPVSKHSKLKQINPFIDADGILRGKGRLESLNCNTPIILPGNHHVTFLVVRHYHELNHHCFHETTINNIRSKFYIPRLRVIYKTVRGKCQRCKNYHCSPVIPQMAPLPRSRLASFERPFTFVGIDFFGPYLVVVGRRSEKRWGVVFTCLTVRAVHIEVSHSLDTSSCIMCVANFIHRRGMPREIFTDNGTNFKSAAKVLKEEQKQINLQQMASKFDEIKWSFNPPAAPHMGGAWERMVKSIKSVLKVTCPYFKFNDESFRNALWEAEFIINSRPLTFVSLEAEDDEPLTPNHLLLGSSSGYKPICSDSDLRDRWRRTQKFANHFWTRWVKEYAPDLLRRGKWYNKQPPASVGDVVVVVDENSPRNTWPKGIIIETTTTKDGQVRRVKIRTSTGVLERPVSKVAILDVGAKSESKLTST